MNQRDLETFRLLVFLSAVTLAVAAVIGFLPMPISDLQLSYMDGGGAGSLVAPHIALYLWLAWLLLCGIAHLLAFFYVWFARHIFLLCFVLATASSVVGGLQVGTPWDNTAWSLHAIFSTFAIGMLFFNPAVRNRTDRDFLEALTKPPELSPASSQLIIPPDTSN